MKIFLVTSTRADFGLLKNIIFEFKKNIFFDLKIIAAGTHFSKEFGNTYKEIKSAKIKLYKKIIINSKFNNSIDISFVISKHLTEITKIFTKSKPDLMIILGDRYEMLAAAIASHISGVPIAHIHGGEVTVGAVDEAFRHSITKMSHIHFVANKIYKNRVIQLGENPKNVFVTGGLGVDSIKTTKLLNKRQIENKLGINFCKKNIIVNFHPETLNKKKIKAQLNELLKALKTLKDTCLIFTGPGADAENILIKKIIKRFINKADNAYYFNSLGQKNYLSILKLVDCMIGNSSSGLLEMPTFRKASINLGIRQKGRIKSQSVIDSKIKTIDIIKSIKKVYSVKFIEILKVSMNPYGSPGASKKIINILKKYKFKNILEKNFYDIKLSNYK
jgi:GDP/UDP-N,N'-diacetylbacillosamine 2-epimerase (hydrolysing)